MSIIVGLLVSFKSLQLFLQCVYELTCLLTDNNSWFELCFGDADIDWRWKTIVTNLGRGICPLRCQPWACSDDNEERASPFTPVCHECCTHAPLWHLLQKCLRRSTSLFKSSFCKKQNFAAQLTTVIVLNLSIKIVEKFWDIYLCIIKCSLFLLTLNILANPQHAKDKIFSDVFSKSNPSEPLS